MVGRLKNYDSHYTGNNRKELIDFNGLCFMVFQRKLLRSNLMKKLNRLDIGLLMPWMAQPEGRKTFFA